MRQVRRFLVSQSRGCADVAPRLLVGLSAIQRRWERGPKRGRKTTITYWLVVAGSPHGTILAAALRSARHRPLAEPASFTAPHYGQLRQPVKISKYVRRWPGQLVQGLLLPPAGQAVASGRCSALRRRGRHSNDALLAIWSRYTFIASPSASCAAHVVVHS